MSGRSDLPPEAYDTWFEILADGLRRRLLFELSSRSPPPASLSVPEDVVRPGEDPESLRLHLTHVHLPKLTSAGVVSWDREEGIVSTGSTFERILPLLDAIEALDEPQVESRD